MEVFDLLKTAHDAAVHQTEHLRFDQNHPWHLHLVGIYGSLIELSSTIVLLIENKKATAVPILFRSFVEAYVDFRNLAADRSYGNHMQAAYNDQWLKVLREAKAGGNPYLAGIGDAANLHAEIQTKSSELDRLKKQGFRALKVIERFDKADMLEEYRSLYNFMCGHTHNDIRALIDRHLEIDDNDFVVVYYKDEPVESFLTYLDSVCSMLIDASQRMHEVLETSRKQVFDGLLMKLKDVRSSYGLGPLSNEALHGAERSKGEIP